tara:strand:+ start:425 stop:847 length:423 start_codon:yes stop_codon:yes gene_type:complete
MSDAKFTTRLYNKPIQNMSQEEAEAYSKGQNTGIIAGISMLPIGKAIGIGGNILTKAPQLSRIIKAFTEAPRQYFNLFSKGINVGDKAKKASAAKDVVTSVPRTGEGNVHPIISGNKIITELPKVSTRDLAQQTLRKIKK